MSQRGADKAGSLNLGLLMDNTLLHLRLMRRTLLSVFSLSWRTGDEKNKMPSMLLLSSSKHPELLAFRVSSS